MCDITASSTFQTDPKNLEQSSGSQKLTNVLLQYLWNDLFVQHAPEVN